jgi:hypothetical protein
MDARELDIVLNHVGELAKYKSAFEQMCNYYYSLMEGDTHRIDDAYKLMREFGIIDEDGEMIYGQEE